MATLKNVRLNRTRADSYPIIDDILLSDCISLVVKCTGQNSVDYSFISSGETGQIKPSETKELITNSDSVNDTIRFTFNGSSVINVTYSTGSSTSSGGDLSYKYPTGGIIRLSSPDAGIPFFPLPINLEKFELKTQGHENIEIYLHDHKITDTEDLVNLLNKYQKTFYFLFYNSIEILTTSNNENYNSLETFRLIWNGGASFFEVTNYTSTIYSNYNSWGDYIAENLNKISQDLKSIVNTDYSYHEVINNPKSYLYVKNLEFFVLDGSCDVELEDNLGNITTLNYPITGANGTINGNTFNFGANSYGRILFTNFAVGSNVYIKVQTL